MSDKFRRQLHSLNISLTDNQFGQFDRFYELLVEWNKVMNLTGITEYEEVNEKHFVDSLSLNQVLSMDSIKSVMDIGTGAGFPGIPLKIAFPHLKIVLLDSLQKRVKFLDEVIKELDLKDIYTLHGRAEDFAKKKEYREQFDVCVSRAVANLSTLSEYCIPYVKKEGKFVSYKGGTIEEEVNQAEKAVHVLGGRIENVVKFQLPGSEIRRSFIVIEKQNTTPKKYPRKAGLPSKEPIN